MDDSQSFGAPVTGKIMEYWQKSCSLYPASKIQHTSVDYQLLYIVKRTNISSNPVRLHSVQIFFLLEV